MVRTELMRDQPASFALSPRVAAAGVAANGSGSSSGPQQGYSEAGQGWRVRWFKQQQGVTRYNCADSLDRTNVGSFFGAVQVGPHVGWGFSRGQLL